MGGGGGGRGDTAAARQAVAPYGGPDPPCAWAETGRARASLYVQNRAAPREHDPCTHGADQTRSRRRGAVAHTKDTKHSPREPMHTRKAGSTACNRRPQHTPSRASGTPCTEHNETDQSKPSRGQTETEPLHLHACRRGPCTRIACRPLQNRGRQKTGGQHRPSATTAAANISGTPRWVGSTAHGSSRPSDLPHTVEAAGQGGQKSGSSTSTSLPDA